MPDRSAEALSERTVRSASHPAGIDLQPAPAEFPRHYLEACLILLLAESPAHGYDLRESVAGLGVRPRDFGQLYRTLRAMERDGLLVSCWENSAAGPRRRTYHVTGKGAARLRSWEATMVAVQRHLAGFLVRRSQGGQPVRSRRPG